MTTDQPKTEAGREAKRIFGPDVEWAAHPDPMTGEDWDRVAALIVEAAAPPSEKALAEQRELPGERT